MSKGTTPNKKVLLLKNEINENALGEFSLTETKIFLTVCFEFQRRFATLIKSRLDENASLEELSKNLPPLVISFNELRSTANYKRKGDAHLIDDIKKLRRKIQSIAVEVSLGTSTEPEDTRRIIIFPTIDIYKSAKKISIIGNPAFIELTCLVYKKYTQIDIEEIMALRSIYGIRLYRLLKQWQFTGVWAVNIETFRSKMNLSDDWTFKFINAKCIDVAMRDVAPYFRNLKLAKIHGQTQGSPVTQLIFTFDAKKTTPAVKTCPICGQPLYERIFNDKVCWCHRDGWREDAMCHKIYNSVEEIAQTAEMIIQTDKRIISNEQNTIIQTKLAEIFNLPD